MTVFSMDVPSSSFWPHVYVHLRPWLGMTLSLTSLINKWPSLGFATCPSRVTIVPPLLPRASNDSNGRPRRMFFPLVHISSLSYSIFA